MQVQLDNVWATRTMLHGRVTVWADDNRWRHRYSVTVPWEEIPAEAVAMAFHEYQSRAPEDAGQDPLF